MKIANVSSSLTALILTIGTAVCASPARAETVSGTLRNNGVEAPLELVLDQKASGQSVVVKIETRPSLLTYLRRMKTGDQIAAQGTVDFSRRRFILESVDRVGLQELLGAWRSSRWEIFEFVDYKRLNLYIPAIANPGGVTPSQTHSLKYVVTPEQDDRFSIFMTDDNDVQMGFIEISKNKLTLSITDSETGQNTENISLSPLVVQ